MQRIGPYEIDGEIARGGMGIVYRARGPRGPVAIKVVLDPDPELRARVRQELSTLTRLEHPGIVALHELVQDPSGRDALVLELVEGESLQQRLTRDGPLPVDEAVALARQLCEAVAHAHDRQVLHRDLKPDNVLLSRDGQVKLTDFGLGKVTDLSRSLSQAPLTRSGELLGTPAYMPPEQAAGERDRMGPAADVYGLGATLFALLTGRAPFKAPSLLNVLRAVLEDPAPRPSSLRPELPPWLDAVVLRCLAKEPEDRYPDVRALGAALKAGADPARSERSPLAVLGGLVALGLVAGFSVALARWPTTAAPSAAPSETPRGDDEAGAEAYEQGAALAEAGDYEGAIAAFDAAIHVRPGDAQAYAARGYTRYCQGDPAGALEDYRRALELGPRDPFKLHLLSCQANHTCGDFEAALADAQQALRLQPRALTALDARGRALVRLGEFEAGFRDLDHVVRNAEPDVEPSVLAQRLAMRGRAHQHLGRTQPALEDYDAAQRLDPALGSVYALRGLLRASTDAAPSDALADLSKAIALRDATRPREELLQARALIRLRALALQGDPDHLERAQADLAEALSIRPDLIADAAYLQLLADSRLLAGEHEAAAEAYTRALDAMKTQDPLPPVELPRIYRNRAHCRSRLDRFEEAIEDLDQSLALDPQADTWLRRAEVHWRIGDQAEAIRDCERALACEPSHPEALDLLARYRREAKTREGSPSPTAGGKPEVAASREAHARGQALERAGRWASAEEAYSEAIRTRPEASLPWAHRARVRRRQSNFAGALDDYTQALRLETDPLSLASLRAARGEVHYQRGLGPPLEPAHYQAALEDSEEALALAPAAPDQVLALRHGLRALALEGVGRTREAVEAFDRSLTLRPQHSEFLGKRGLLRQRIGDRQGAVADMLRSIELDPNAGRVPALTLACADCCLSPQVDDPELAQDVLGRLPRSDPGPLIRSLARCSSADAWLATGDTQRADEALEGLPALLPALTPEWRRRLNGFALWLRGELGDHRGDPVLALTCVEQSLSLAPDEAKCLALRGRLRLRRGEREAGLDDLRRAFEATPNGLAALWLAATSGDLAPLRAYRDEPGWLGALAQHQLGLLSEEELLERAQRVEPARLRPRRVAQAHGYAGLRLEHAGDREAAAARYEDCVESGLAGHPLHAWAAERLRQWRQD